MNVKQEQGRQRKPRRGEFMDKIIYWSIIAVTLYTTMGIILHFTKLIEISPTLTTCWFSFWTVEIVALCTIKHSKIKHGQDDYEYSTDDTINMQEEWKDV